MPRDKLIIFVKAPRPGTVKTRLAKEIGETAALEAYRELVHRLIENLRDLSNVELRYTPDDAAEEIDGWRLVSWTLAAQGGGDLGTRMQRAFEQSLKTDRKKAIVIGSDCPTITVSDIRQGFDKLAFHDAVLGPSRDGGYWLIGLKRAHPKLFRNMKWSTATVFQETLNRMRRLNLTCAILPEKTDIDDAKSWERYKISLKPC